MQPTSSLWATSFSCESFGFILFLSKIPSSSFVVDFNFCWSNPDKFKSTPEVSVFIGISIVEIFSLLGVSSIAGSFYIISYIFNYKINKLKSP